MGTLDSVIAHYNAQGDTYVGKTIDLASGTTTGAEPVVDIRNYVTSGKTFDLGAVVAAMEAGGGACYIPPGDWTPIAWNVGMNETGVASGGTLKSRFTYRFFGSGKHCRVMLPNAMTSTDYLLIANPPNTGLMAHIKVIFEDFAVAGATQGNSSNFFLSNARSFTAKRIYLANMLNGFTHTGYSDACRIEQVYTESMTAGGWAFTGINNGDGLVIDQLFMNGTGGINLRGCVGASVRSCIGGYHQFNACEVTFEECHFEGDSYTGPIPTVFLRGSLTNVRSGFYQAKKYRPTFVIDDNGGTQYSRTIFGENVNFGQRIDDTTSTYGPAKGVDVDIVNLSQKSEVTFRGCRSNLFYQSQALGSGGSGYLLEMAPQVTASGMSAIQTALTANPLRVAMDSTIRYAGGGIWEIAPTNRLPIPTKALTTTFLSATAVSSAYLTTDGANGTYFYKAWVIDHAGRTNNPSSETSCTTTSGSPLAALSFSTVDVPAQLVIERGTTTGVYTQWAVLNVTEFAQSVYDQGTYIGGVAWSSTSVPTVPTTTGSFGQTVNGLLYTDTGNSEIRAGAAPTVGSWIAGDRCWNTSAAAGAPPGWICTSPGSPGTWIEMARTWGITSTVTAAGTTTLNATSTSVQVFTGSAIQTVLLPSTGVVPGQSFTINNQSSSTLTVSASGGTSMALLTAQNWSITAIALQAAPTLPSHWIYAQNYTYAASSTGVVALSLALRDGSLNIKTNAFIPAFTTTASSATPYTMTVTSSEVQEFTGTNAQTVNLPTSSIVAGQTYRIINNSTGAITLQASGGQTVLAFSSAVSVRVTALIASPTLAAHWAVMSGVNNNITSGAAGNTLALRASTGNLFANAFGPGFTTTATAGTTSTLTSSTTEVQVFTGSSNQTVTLPSASISAGQRVTVMNLSTGVVTVQSSGTNTVLSLNTNYSATFVALVATPSTAAHWSYLFSPSITADPAAATGNTLVQRTGLGNITGNALIPNFRTQATAGGTTTLLASDGQTQVFTGSSTQIVALPSASIVVGREFKIINNNSSGALTINASGGALVKTLAAGASTVITALIATPTAATDWYATA